MPEQPTPRAEIENVNVALTREFSAAWSAKDTDRLLDIVHDDVQWMVYDGGPVHSGPAGVEAAARPFMAKFQRVEFNIVDIKVIGPVVIHERTEDYYGSDGEVDTHFHVSGLFVFKDARILIWRDYGVPGSQQMVGPLVLGKSE